MSDFRSALRSALGSESVPEEILLRWSEASSKQIQKHLRGCPLRFQDCLACQGIVAAVIEGKIPIGNRDEFPQFHINEVLNG